MTITNSIKHIVFLLLVCLTTGLHATTQFRVIVDASGSMVISDPDKLTAESLRLIANLAPETETTLGIWLFGERPRVLLPEEPVSDALRKKLSSYVDAYVTSDLKTDLESILQMLIDEADNTLDPNVEKHWILVTDGMVDISLDNKVNEASKSRITGPILNALINKKVHLHTVSMTGYTDKALLETLSRETDASHTEVALPEDLLPTFNKIFSLAATSDQLPFEDNTFFVDSSINEFTLLVFHDADQQPKVVQPNNQRLNLKSNPLVKAATGSHYTLITVTEPMQGTWKVEDVDIEKSTIRVLADLRVQASKVPPVIFLNEPLYSSIGIYQDGGLIQDNTLLDLVKVKQTLFKRNGESLLEVDDKTLSLSANQYKNAYPSVSALGDYELRSFVDGQTFLRQLTQYFSVHEPIAFSVEVNEGGMVTYTAKPSHLRLNILRSHLTLEITRKNGTKEQTEVSVIGQGFWQKVAPLAGDFFTARVKLNGVTQTGVRFDYWSPSWTIDRTAGGEAKVSFVPLPKNVRAIKSFATDSREVMSVFTPPALLVQLGTEEFESLLPVVSEELSEEPAAPKANGVASNLVAPEVAAPVEELEISKEEWLLYVGWNLAGLLAAGLAFWGYRRVAANKQKNRASEQSTSEGSV